MPNSVSFDPSKSRGQSSPTLLCETLLQNVSQHISTALVCNISLTGISRTHLFSKTAPPTLVYDASPRPLLSTPLFPEESPHDFDFQRATTPFATMSRQHFSNKLFLTTCRNASLQHHFPSLQHPFQNASTSTLV